MKTTLSLLLLSVSATAGVYSIESPARHNLRSAAVETPTGEELNANLREAASIFVSGPSNLHQCLNHCERHTSKSQQWIEECEEDCYDQYSQPTCYNQGDSCKKDEDCLTGGTNVCNKCGQVEGAEFYHECYRETPSPTPSPIEEVCYNLGQSCEKNSDCHTGGPNFCHQCGQTHGTEYFHRCYSPNGDEEDEGRVLELIEEDGPTWGDIKNGTKRAAEKTADGTEEAGKKTAEWGKDTFDPSSGYYARSGALLVAIGSLTVAVIA